MSGPFFGGGFFGGGFFGALTGGGVPSAPSPQKIRRRYIFPDGSVVLATVNEALELLAQYARMVPIAAPSAKAELKIAARQKTVRVPRIELEKIEWKQATDTAGELMLPVLPTTIVWEPDRKQLAQTIAQLKRKIDDEEALIALFA